MFEDVLSWDVLSVHHISVDFSFFVDFIIQSSCMNNFKFNVCVFNPQQKHHHGLCKFTVFFKITPLST